ncbi:hypothetical protein JZ751_003575 [Albula glossodonta]|uniref:Glucagon / GIP / secretin / VIP family domain-containing protein n=1 Tax=Albula glossodonta TaxID=121402 RepID=A0A8T2MV84_9TELE|nr:hypothetical protein JZ751_003575 [Albula glossodonta]
MEVLSSEKRYRQANDERVRPNGTHHDVSRLGNASATVNRTHFVSVQIVNNATEEEFPDSAVHSPVQCVIFSNTGATGDRNPSVNKVGAFSLGDDAVDEQAPVKRHSDAVFTDNYSRFRKQMAVKKFLNSVLTGKRSLEDPPNAQEESVRSDPSLQESYDDITVDELLNHLPLTLCVIGPPTSLPASVAGVPRLAKRLSAETVQGEPCH